jgi:hypothetical protein
MPSERQFRVCTEAAPAPSRGLGAQPARQPTHTKMHENSLPQSPSTERTPLPHTATRDGVAQIPVSLDAARVPESLRALPQWIAWRLKPAPTPGGKVGKVPVNPHTGRNASTTNSVSWGTFEQALASLERYGLAGVGFVFTKESGVVGVDLDKCRDAETGELEPWAQGIVETLNSYTEVSPTGTGVHVLARGELPSSGRRHGPVEMYDSGRFFTVTGQRIHGTPSTIEQRQEGLSAVHAKWIASRQDHARDELPQASAHLAPAENSVDIADATAQASEVDSAEATSTAWKPVVPRQELTDDELLAAARRAKNGPKFAALFDEGRIEGYASASEADLALCAMLAFWTGRDPERINRLFRQSMLFREKWMERRGESIYGETTVARALSGVTTFWTPRPAPRFAKTWRRRLGDVDLTCERQGYQTLVIQGVADDGSKVVDRFQYATDSGRRRIAERLSVELPQLSVEQVADALQELAAAILGERAAADEVLGADDADGRDDQDGDSSDAEMFAALVVEAEDVELFHTPGRHDAQAFATITLSDHRETWSVRSQVFKLWALQRFREKYHRVPASSAQSDGLNAIAAGALFEGAEHQVHIRVAEHEQAVYVDLGDDHWKAVRVSADGWEVIDSERVPVRFIRRRGMQALPPPLYGYSIDALRPFVNLPDNSAWRLFVLVLVTYLLPTGPYVVLIVNGEQGSAKSSLMRVARGLVDPNKAGLRRPPSDERDLIIAASNSWIVAFDNISALPAKLSDSLCTLATGGGFGARELYSDDEEKLFDAMRPVMLNGIEDVATRADLLDRAIILHLPAIPDEARKQDEEQRAGFESVRAGVLGALLSGVASVIRWKGSVKLARRPRMADFATSAVAAARHFGWSEAEVLELIEASRRAANEVAIGNSLVAEGVTRLLSDSREWRGTCGGLLEVLSGESDPASRHRAGWPKNARGMRGALTRAAPNLRRAGIEVDFERSGREGTRDVILRRVRGQPSAPSAPSVPPKDGHKKGDSGLIPADGRGARSGQPSADRQQIEPQKPHAEGVGRVADGADDADGRAGTSESAQHDDFASGQWEVV